MNRFDIVLNYGIIGINLHYMSDDSSKEFLKLVSPEIALIGVGENNKFGHPNQEVIERLKERKIRIYRTDNNGEISIEIDSKSKIKIGTKYQ